MNSPVCAAAFYKPVARTTGPFGIEPLSDRWTSESAADFDGGAGVDPR